MKKKVLRGSGKGPGVFTVHVPEEPARKPGIDYPDKLLPLFAERPGFVDVNSEEYRQRYTRLTEQADRLELAAAVVTSPLPLREK